jgi:hypothetical protein
MKMKTRFGLILALGLVAALPLTAQKPADMQGTWSGPATLEGMSDSNDFTLVLELKEGKLEGRISDQYNTLSDSPIDEIKLETEEFSFSVMGMGPGGQEIKLVLKMKIDGDSMKGTLEIPDMGMNGTWEATKQK